VQPQEKGLVIIYTGNGKGKTTAALGVVLRAVGYKKKCLVVQFGKNWFTGELIGLKKLGVKTIQGGKGFVGILGDRKPIEEHKKAALDTYNYIYKEVISGKWDIVVADEIIGTVSSKLLPVAKAVSLITDKPASVDLILTGRSVPKKLIKMADLVTEMREMKHPYQQGILAKKGIDF
jgi:cob(I)alamin adenosyltransferase